MPSQRTLRRADPDEVDEDDGARYAEAVSEKAMEPSLRDYEPHFRQRIFHAIRTRRRARFRAACAGRRGGKTRAGGAELGDEIQQLYWEKRLGIGRWSHLGPSPPWKANGLRDPVPFLRFAVISPTSSLLNEPKQALGRVLGHSSMGGWIAHQSAHRWWLLGGICVDFLSAERPQTLVSHPYDGIWIDEVARVKESAWTENLAPALADTGGGAIFTTTPLGKNWFYSEVWAKGNRHAADEIASDSGCAIGDILNPAFGCYKWTTADNTSIPRLAEEMEAMRAVMPDAMWRRSFLADFDTFIGQVFDLEHGAHFLQVTASECNELWIGVDYGFTHRSAVCLTGRRFDGSLAEIDTIARPEMLPDTDSAWALRYHSDRTTLTTCAFQLAYQARGEDWQSVPIYHPTDRPDITKSFKNRGFLMKRSNQRPAVDLDFVKVALKQERLTISSRTLWNEMTNLRHPAKGRWSTKPWVSEGDDAWDGFRAALSRPIQVDKQPRLGGADTGWRYR